MTLASAMLAGSQPATDVRTQVWMVFGDRTGSDLDAVVAARASEHPHINSFLMEFSRARDHSCLR
jgi:hypothetical protein